MGAQRLNTLALYLGVLVLTPVLSSSIRRIANYSSLRIYKKLANEFLRDYDLRSAMQAGFYREAASVKEEDCAFKQAD